MINFIYFCTNKYVQCFILHSDYVINYAKSKIEQTNPSNHAAEHIEIYGFRNKPFEIELTNEKLNTSSLCEIQRGVFPLKQYRKDELESARALNSESSPRQYLIYPLIYTHNPGRDVNKSSGKTLQKKRLTIQMLKRIGKNV